jgi:hypothetical protein
MHLHPSAVFAAIACSLVISCYPYKEPPRRRLSPKKPVHQTALTPEPPKLRESPPPVKGAEEEKPQEVKPEEEPKTTAPQAPVTTPPPKETPKPPVEKKPADYSVANKVPGKEGFVFSPYNNKVIDVRDMPSGTLVQDPTYTGAGKGYFRVP